MTLFAEHFFPIFAHWILGKVAFKMTPISSHKYSCGNKFAKGQMRKKAVHAWQDTAFEVKSFHKLNLQDFETIPLWNNDCLLHWHTRAPAFRLVTGESWEKRINTVKKPFFKGRGVGLVIRFTINDEYLLEYSWFLTTFLINSFKMSQLVIKSQSLSLKPSNWKTKLNLFYFSTVHLRQISWKL